MAEFDSAIGQHLLKNRNCDAAYHDNQFTDLAIARSFTIKLPAKLLSSTTNNPNFAPKKNLSTLYFWSTGAWISSDRKMQLFRWSRRL